MNTLLSTEVYKGFVETAGKTPICKYKDLPSYDIEGFRFDDVKDKDSYAGLLSKEAVLLDFDDERSAEKALKIIIGEELNALVYKTTRGIHAIFKNTSEFRTTTKKQLACGRVS